jgi:putative transposase
VSPTSRHINKSHNVSVLLYHLVLTAKYRKEVLSPKVIRYLLRVCKELEERYEIYFLEIGTDKDHAHFLIQSVPTYSPTKIVRTMKSILAREIFKKAPGVKRALWGGSFWTSGYYINTVGQHGTELLISNYVKNQGNDQYKQEFRVDDSDQLKIFS